MNNFHLFPKNARKPFLNSQTFCMASGSCKKKSKCKDDFENKQKTCHAPLVRPLHEPPTIDYYMDKKKEKINKQENKSSSISSL